MSTLQELIAQKEALEKQIEATRHQAKAGAIAQVKQLMEQHGLSVSDLKGSKKQVGGKGSKVAAKYRNGPTGETWSGRGLQPKWLKTLLQSGRKLEEFAV